MTHEQFKQICILSGTDYNINANGDNKHNNLYQVVKHFNNYRQTEITETFYRWLQEKTDCISDIELLNKINTMFDLNEEKENLRVFNDIKVVNGPIKQDEIVSIMTEENFIFIQI